MSDVHAGSDEPEGLRERVGTVIGALWTPAIAALARLRHARMFHPDGHAFTGTCRASHGPDARRDPALAAIGDALAGRVLARFSGALWKGDVERFDVLGLALRFRPGAGPALDATPQPGDTDLLTATIRSPLTMLASPLFTDARDFVGNKYWAVSPFAVPGARVELRLVPGPATRDDEDGARLDRLRAAVRAGHATWWLEARRTLRLGWRRVAQVSIEREVAIDQDALRFDPFRGVLRPVGLVHAIRRAAYPASQGSRPASRADRSADQRAARDERAVRANENSSLNG